MLRIAMLGCPDISHGFLDLSHGCFDHPHYASHCSPSNSAHLSYKPRTDSCAFATSAHAFACFW